MVKTLANGAISLYKPDEVRRLKVKLYGHKREFKASLGMAFSVAQGASFETLVFGFPRIGKTTLPYVLAKSLNVTHDLKFSLAMIDCDLCQTDNMKEIFNAIEWANKSAPTIVAFDEFEGCAPRIPDLLPTTPAAIQSRRIRWYTSERELRPKILLLCISNYPEIIELATTANFDSAIYFDDNDAQAVEEIIQSLLHVDNSDDIASELIARRAKDGFATLGFTVLKVCERLAVAGQLDMLRTKSVIEIAEILNESCAPGASLNALNSYRDKYKDWIAYSQNHLQWYEALADEIQKKKNA